MARRRSRSTGHHDLTAASLRPQRIRPRAALWVRRIAGGLAFTAIGAAIARYPWQLPQSWWQPSASAGCRVSVQQPAPAELIHLQLALEQERAARAAAQRTAADHAAEVMRLKQDVLYLRTAADVRSGGPAHLPGGR